MALKCLFSGDRRVVSMAPFLFREVFPAPYSLQGLAARLLQRGPAFTFSCSYCFLSEACASHGQRGLIPCLLRGWEWRLDGTTSIPLGNKDAFFIISYTGDFFFNFKIGRGRHGPWVCLIDVVSGKAVAMTARAVVLWWVPLFWLSLLWSAGLSWYLTNAAWPLFISEWMSLPNESNCCN